MSSPQSACKDAFHVCIVKSSEAGPWWDLRYALFLSASVTSLFSFLFAGLSSLVLDLMGIPFISGSQWVTWSSSGSLLLLSQLSSALRVSMPERELLIIFTP